MRLDLGAATDVGRVRESNEDAVLVLPPGEHDAASPFALVGVADGMGGHQAGEVASAMALEKLASALRGRSNGGVGQTVPLGAALKRAVEQANRAIWEAANVDRERHGMGTTLVCALMQSSGEAVVANVGDSRAYVVSGHGAQQLTHDHSWVAEQVRAGRMSERDAERSPYRHVLSRSLGVMATVEADLYADLRLAPGDALVLCSDGVSSYVGAEDLVSVLAASRAAQDAAQRLVQLAVQRGGHDNATVAVARLVE